MSSVNSRTHNNDNGSRISSSTYANNNNNNNNRRKSVASATSKTGSLLAFKDQISNEVSQNRRQEIHDYMSLFGYKPDRTIVQVHITGFFRKKTYSQRQIEQHRAASRRYGGTTFVVIGRTHDPSIMDIVIKPKQKSPYDISPGYIGYLWKNKESLRRAPHEVIPLDFTPVHLPYPADWKNRFATKGFMIALHVPSSLAKSKNGLTRALYRIGKTRVDVKKEWKFLNELKNINYVREEQHFANNTEMQSVIHAGNSVDKMKRGRAKRRTTEEDKGSGDPLHILKGRLAKGEITKNEYNELYNAISS
jgi:hypothetical protein